VVQIPSDAYGPTTIDGVTYASADAGQTTPLVGATVIVGPVPIVGATAPAVLPAGDVAMTSGASGAFSGSVSVAPSAPLSQEPFVVPSLNLSGIATPASGYYVEVFGAGSDAVSPGASIPVHRFMNAQSPLAIHVSTLGSAESAALLQVNSDRQSYAGVAPLVFDEIAEETARLHATDETNNNYFCHYDLHNVGPASRYLAASGLGETGENLAATTGATSALGFSYAEDGFLSERSTNPQGGHYLNLIDSTHAWAGLAATVFAGGVQVDYELISPSGVDPTFAVSGYETGTGCGGFIEVNNS
jgi:uncharacterized protein YkwD